jgi:hypothetical protein
MVAAALWPAFFSLRLSDLVAASATPASSAQIQTMTSADFIGKTWHSRVAESMSHPIDLQRQRERHERVPRCPDPPFCPD